MANKKTNIFLPLLTLILITFKLTKVIAWSWVWVLSPIWIPIALTLLILIITLGVVVVLFVFRVDKGKIREGLNKLKK